MKTFLGLILALLLFAVVFVGGGLLWYLSSTAEFSQKGSPEVTALPPTQR